MIRVLDLLISIIVLLLLAPVILLLLVIAFFDTGAPIFCQKRVGIHGKPFTIYKVRTMVVDTPSVATHLADYTKITPFGRFLRRSKLDEVPQLWNVIIGDMSIVGPRPCLPEQHELINERTSLGVFKARPGITGLAQIKHIDMSTPALLAQTDKKMLEGLNLRTYLLYIIRTVVGGGMGDRVRYR